MENYIAMEVPLGYRIVDRTKQVDIWDAEEILASKRQKYYTRAVRRKDTAELVGSFLVCPYCGAEFVANTKHFGIVDGHYLPRRVSRTEVYKWSTRQVSLFDEDIDKTINFSNTIISPEYFECPKCEMRSKQSGTTRHVSIEQKKKKVTIRSELVGLDEILSLQWLKTNSFSVCPPMYETLVFDLGRGRVYIKLENSHEELVDAMDITQQPEVLSDDPLGKLICTNKLVNRTIKRMFSYVWQMPLPFKSREITIPNLFRMTTFVNYQKEFYSAVPYCVGSLCVEKSFQKTAELLHDACNLETFYMSSRLPQTKSVRKKFFSSPGLLFYMREAEIMRELMGDINHFCRFINSPVVYEVLSELHTRPGILDYFRDFCRVKGAKSLLSNLLHRWSETKDAAIDYATLCNSGKKAIQKTWLKRKHSTTVRSAIYRYSIPMRRPEENVRDCTIDGYDFFWLRNSGDYYAAAQKLENCLGSWSCEDAPVVCVKQKGEYLAAIEIDDGEIVQMRGYRNHHIYDETKLGMAIEKWRKMYGLDCSTPYYDFD